MCCFSLLSKIVDQKNLLFRVDESYPEHMKVTPVDGNNQYRKSIDTNQ